MDSALILSNLLNPPVLFFFLGMLAVAAGSDLEIPQPLPKFFSLYLLLSIGFKGGVELHRSGLTAEVGLTLTAAVFMAIVVPVWTFAVLRRRFDVNNAAAIAATYGSVSAVTFIAASSFLAQLGIPSGGHMVAAMALMESPAIIVGIALARWLRKEGSEFSWRHLLRDSFANASVFVLCGALVIGLVTGESGGKALAPFTSEIFRGVLCLFLLDMGVVSARRLGGIRGLGVFPVAFAALVPLINAAAAIAIAYLLGLGRGRCTAPHGALRQRELHRRARRHAVGPAGGKPGTLRHHVTGPDVPLQHSPWPPALPHGHQSPLGVTRSNSPRQTQRHLTILARGTAHLDVFTANRGPYSLRS